jgi:hypothetical protein
MEYIRDNDKYDTLTEHIHLDNCSPRVLHDMHRHDSEGHPSELKLRRRRRRCRVSAGTAEKFASARRRDQLRFFYLCIACVKPGLEITRIASQFAIQYRSIAMQLRFCIAVSCDTKTAVVLLSIYFYYLSRVTIP